ncbi:hypothetical protein HWV62_22499 [Athelia sp. TMB]|nr:hypothetical protein HWV62_22499 [Athelia sp. TMB]
MPTSASSLPAELDPQLISVDISGVKASIAKYKKANRGLKMKMGGQKYIRELEKRLDLLHKDLRLAEDPKSPEELPYAFEEDSTGPPAESNTMEIDDHSGGNEHGESTMGEGEGNIEEQDEPLIDAADILAMRCLWVDALHQKALIGFPVPFDKVKGGIERIIVGQAGKQEVELYVKGWAQLQMYGDFACQTGEEIVADVIGWKYKASGDALDWKERLCIVKWIQEAQKELQSQKDQENALSLEFFSYEDDKTSLLTRKAALLARTDMRAHPGTVEAGEDVALLVLGNRNSEQKCLTCHNSARGLNKPKQGQAWLQVDPSLPRLGCGCHVSSALMELVMTKAVATKYTDFPVRPPPKAPKASVTFPHSDFNFNPVTIAMVERFVYDLTRQNAGDLLCQPQVRLLRVIVGATEQLGCSYQRAFREAADNQDEEEETEDVQYREELELLKEFKGKVERFSTKLARLQEKHGLPGGPVKYSDGV